MIALTLLLPLTPLGRLFGFVPLPPTFLGHLALILLAYGLTAEAAKAQFYRTVPLLPSRQDQAAGPGVGGSTGLGNHKGTG